MSYSSWLCVGAAVLFVNITRPGVLSVRRVAPGFGERLHKASAF